MQSSRKAQHLAALAACSAAMSAVALIIRKKRRAVSKRTRQRQPKFLRPALLRGFGSNGITPWKQLLSNGTDSDFIIALNFPMSLIQTRILPHFEDERAKLSHGSPYRTQAKSRGRVLHITSLDLIGIALWYIKSCGTQYTLCPIFGLVPSSVNVWLDYAMEVLWRTVRKSSRRDFEIRWPTIAEMESSSQLLCRTRSFGFILKGVFAVVDGGRFRCADYLDTDVQNAFFEGYTQEVEVTNLFVWNFYGEVIHAAINFPGSWHDNKLAYLSGLVQDKLSDAKTPPGYAILGDSAFVCDTKSTNGKVVRGRKSNETKNIPTSLELAAVDTILQRIMPSERQSAEWGVRAIKGVFGRLKQPLSADSVKRERLITICVHLVNLRTRFVGLNQIRTTYAEDTVSANPWLIPFIEGGTRYSALQR